MNDLQLAREKQQQFDDWKKAGEKELAIELSVNVLTTGFWPTYKARSSCPCCRNIRLQCLKFVPVGFLCLSYYEYTSLVWCTGPPCHRGVV